MKFFAVFAAIVAVACGAPTSWNMNQLSDAIQNPHTNPAYLPYLEEALNEMVAAVFAGQQIETVTVTIPTTEVPSMSLAQISEALENPETNPALVPYLEDALNQMMEDLVSGVAPVAAASASITVPAMDVSSWTLFELSDALQDPSTNPALVPYLETALNQVMETLVAGEQIDFIVIATPAGIISVESVAPVDAMPVMPTPAEVAPVEVTPVVVVDAAPVDAAPVAAVAPAAPSSPLVQIIININQQDASEAAPTPVAVSQPTLIPEPVNIIDSAPIAVEPVIVVDSAPAVPEGVSIIDNVPVAVEPVSIVETAPLAPESVIVVDSIPTVGVPIGVISPISPIAVHPIGVVAPA